MNANSVSAFEQSVSVQSTPGGEARAARCSACSLPTTLANGVWSVADGLSEGCRTDSSMYASAAERMIAAIGEPT